MKKLKCVLYGDGVTYTYTSVAVDQSGGYKEMYCMFNY